MRSTSSSALRVAQSRVSGLGLRTRDARLGTIITFPCAKLCRLTPQPSVRSIFNSKIDEFKNFPLTASVEISTPSGISTAASSTIILTEDNFTDFELKLVHFDCALTRWHSPCPPQLRNEENEIEEDPINSDGPVSNRGSSMDSGSGSTLPRQRFP